MQTDRGTKFIWKTSRRAVATAAATTIVLSACNIGRIHSGSNSRATVTAVAAAAAATIRVVTTATLVAATV